MNNTTTAPAVSIVVTECNAHGTVSAPDTYTAQICVEVARDCAAELAQVTGHGHESDVSCWVCCADMVIDPQGIFDH